MLGPLIVAAFPGVIQSTINPIIMPVVAAPVLLSAATIVPALLLTLTSFTISTSVIYVGHRVIKYGIKKRSQQLAT